MTDVTVSDGKVNVSGVAMMPAGGGQMLSFTSVAEVLNFAQVMAKADIAIPKHIRGNVGACMAIIMQASRWEMDPFSVANKSYLVNDRLAYEAQLIAAVVNTRAPIAERPQYEFSGVGPTLQCKVTVEMVGGAIRTYDSPQFKDITTKNSPLWKADPEQQLGYFSIRSWARRHAPEVILGVYDRDEIEGSPDIGRRPPTASNLVDRLKAAGSKAPNIIEHVEQETGEVIEQSARADEHDQFDDDFPGDR